MRILKENTENIENFIDEIVKKFNISDELKNIIEDFIINSNCQKIEFAKFKFPALGLALHDKVLINMSTLNGDLEYLLFVIFHEIAHQYQYKKYGVDIMYKCYIGEMTDIQAGEWLRDVEYVADDYARRKIIQLQKKDLINKNFKSPQIYKSLSFNSIVNMIKRFRDEIKNSKITTPEGISGYFYNLIKSQF